MMMLLAPLRSTTNIIRDNVGVVTLYLYRHHYHISLFRLVVDRRKNEKMVILST